MAQSMPLAAHRPVITLEDWTLISRALSAYSHNSEYQAVIQRLSGQMGAAETARKNGRSK